MHAAADRRLPIQVLPDKPPTAEIVSPTEEVVIVPEGHVALSLVADDDLAVKTLRLQLSNEALPAPQPLLIEVLHGSDQPEAGPREVSFLLNVSTFAPSPGTVWSLRAQAEDYLGQTAENPRPLRLRIVGREELSQRLDELTSRLAATLERALAAQQQAAEMVAVWQREEKSPPHEGQIAQAASHQRLVAEALASGPASAIELANTLAAEFERNNWPDDSARAQIQQVQAVVEGIVARELPMIDAGLSALARELQQSAPADRSQQLSAIHDPQQAVVVALESLLRDLSQSEEVQQHKRELAELQHDQHALRQKTEEAARNSLSRPPSEPRTEEEQAAKELAAQQRELAARLAGAVTRLRAGAQSLASSKPMQAARLNEAASVLEQSPAPAALHQAAEDLAARRFGQAAENQRAAEKQLEALVNRLMARSRKSNEDRLQALQEAEKKLEDLRKKNDDLAAAQSPTPESNKATAESLAEKTQKLAERLDQLRAGAAAKAAGQAASALQQNKAAASAAQQAQGEFKKAQQELDAERRREKTVQSKRLVEELNLALSRLVADQQLVAQDAAALASGDSKEDRAAKAKDIAARQTTVREATAKEADKIEQLPVFARLLRMAAATMKSAEAKLDAADNFKNAVPLAEQAHSQLKQLAEAVNLQARQQAQPPRPPADGAKQDNGQKPPEDKSDQIQALQLAVSQLTLLRAMQDDLKAMTAELETSRANNNDKKLAPEQRQQLKDLTSDQQDLAELAKSLMQDIELPADDSTMYESEEATPGGVEQPSGVQ
jgi:hypothetical protein